MSGVLKTLLALWLLLLGVAQGKCVYTAEPPLGNFSLNSSEVLEDQPPETLHRTRENDRSGWDGALGKSYCHNDPVNKVDRLGLDEVTVTDGNARYNFVDEVNGARGGWLKKTLDYVFLAKFDGSERKFTGSVALGPVSGGMVSLPGGASVPLSDLQTMADGRLMGRLDQAERMQLLTGDINGWLSRNEGAGGSKLVGTLDKIISSPFQAMAGPDALTILTGIADKHDGFSFGVDLQSRNYARGIHLGTEVDDGIQVASMLMILNPRNAPSLVRGAEIISPRHLAWAGDLTAMNATVERLGMRALKYSGGDWRVSEQLFEGYLQGVQNRLTRTGSPLFVEIQPAAIPGIGRVPAFRRFGDRIFATKGSRRLDAGIADGEGNILSGFDITLDRRKANIVDYYQEAFGDVPIFDIRLPE